MTTVELIAEEAEWTPDPTRRAWNTVVGVRIAAEERTLQRTVKAAGGKRNPEKKVWEMLYQKVIELT